MKFFVVLNIYSVLPKFKKMQEHDVDHRISVVLFPNPTNGNATFSLNGPQKKGESVSVINAQGIPVRSYLVAPKARSNC